MYQSHKTAAAMRWHAEHQSKEGEMNHPSDAAKWRYFQELHPQFAEEPRNVYLGLCTDGFNPFGMSRNHSLWPVILTPYNLPPGMCMNTKYLFITILNSGPNHPRASLDVFLQPLIEELKELWSTGVDVYDVSLNQNFNLKAVLLWTISDFPAYSMLLGWTTHGKLSCPVCMESTKSFYLPNGRKTCWFDCHRRFLPHGHPSRRNRKDFLKGRNASSKYPPESLTGEQVYYERLASVNPPKTKDVGGNGHEKKMRGYGKEHNWHKESILWELSYWKDLNLRHNIDVMHTEKNFLDNIMNTLMSVKGKSKDNIMSRLDIEKFCSRPGLHIDSNGKAPFPAYTLTEEAKQSLLQCVKHNIRFPDGYSSDLASCVDLDNGKFSGMKSHDCHVFMERLLPFIFAELLDRNVHLALSGNILEHYFSISYLGSRDCARTFEQGENYADSSDEADFYGTLTDFIELEYEGIVNLRITLFKCKWYDPKTGRGTRRSHGGVVDVLSTRKYNKYEPFILVSNLNPIILDYDVGDAEQEDEVRCNLSSSDEDEVEDEDIDLLLLLLLRSIDLLRSLTFNLFDLLRRLLLLLFNILRRSIMPIAGRDGSRKRKTTPNVTQRAGAGGSRPANLPPQYNFTPAPAVQVPATEPAQQHGPSTSGPHVRNYPPPLQLFQNSTTQPQRQAPPPLSEEVHYNPPPTAPAHSWDVAGATRRQGGGSASDTLRAKQGAVVLCLVSDSQTKNRVKAEKIALAYEQNVREKLSELEAAASAVSDGSSLPRDLTLDEYTTIFLEEAQRQIEEQAAYNEKRDAEIAAREAESARVTAEQKDKLKHLSLVEKYLCQTDPQFLDFIATHSSTSTERWCIRVRVVRTFLVPLVPSSKVMGLILADEHGMTIEDTVGYKMSDHYKDFIIEREWVTITSFGIVDNQSPVRPTTHAFKIRFAVDTVVILTSPVPAILHYRLASFSSIIDDEIDTSVLVATKKEALDFDHNYRRYGGGVIVVVLGWWKIDRYFDGPKNVRVCTAGPVSTVFPDPDIPESNQIHEIHMRYDQKLLSQAKQNLGRGGGRVGWLTEWFGLLLGLCDRVSVSAVRMDWFFSSAIEYNWWTGKVDCLNGLYGLLWDQVEVSGWTAELTASLSATCDRALSVILGSLPMNKFTQVQGCLSAKEAWDILQDSFKGTSNVKRTCLDMLALEFVNLTMEVEESVDDFTDKLSSITQEAVVLGKTYKDKKMVKTFLKSLPDKLQSHKSLVKRESNPKELEDNLRNIKMLSRGTKDFDKLLTAGRTSNVTWGLEYDGASSKGGTRFVKGTTSDEKSDDIQPAEAHRMDAPSKARKALTMSMPTHNWRHSDYQVDHNHLRSKRTGCWGVAMHRYHYKSLMQCKMLTGLDPWKNVEVQVVDASSWVATWSRAANSTDLSVSSRLLKRKQSGAVKKVKRQKTKKGKEAAGSSVADEVGFHRLRLITHDANKRSKTILSRYVCEAWSTNSLLPRSKFCLVYNQLMPELNSCKLLMQHPVKFDVEKHVPLNLAIEVLHASFQVFNENSDFSLWKKRMKAHLSLARLKGVIDDLTLTKVVPFTKSEGKKVEEGDDDGSESSQTKVVLDLEKMEKSEHAMNVIIVHVGDVVLRKIDHCKSVAEMWETLNKLYMETSLPNRIYVELKFYSFKMNDTMSINKNVNEFLKIVAKLSSLEIVVGEEVCAILFLNGFTSRYSQLKHTLKYENKALSLQDVISSAKSLERELNESLDLERSSSTVLYTTERVAGDSEASTSNFGVITELVKKRVSSKQGGVTTDPVEVSESESEEDSEEPAEPAETQSPEPSGLTNYQLARDITRRQIVAPAKMKDYSQFSFALMTYEVLNVEEEPQCLHDAKKDENSELWNGAIGKEMDSLTKNATWELVDRPKDRKAISCKWLFKIKAELEQMDVKTAFLHGELEEELYMEQLEGVVSVGNEDKCVYVKTVNNEELVYLLLYVDDMLIAAKNMSEVNKVKKRLSSEFEMKDMGAASKILGIEIKRDRVNGVLCLSQAGYLKKVLKRFNMSNCKSAITPIGTHFKLASVQDDSECIDTVKTPCSSAIGSVMYAMISTRPDLAYAIGLVSRFMSKPGLVHWEGIKWLLSFSLFVPSKMAKNRVLTIFYGAIYYCICFKYVLLGMVVEKTQGHICHDYLEGDHCDPRDCNLDCRDKWKGTGTCEPPTGTPLTRTCYCTYDC
ncbi:Transposon En/Spm-like [Arabidopsis thaliana x Arabidopsis arenosa]|uniref:Transposon En/Spm-like n=1 Tax=Arabidopsis thaliana x Arabidopsis arenosa TaxID=1240361 RepID=A0A8T2FKV4_9BRAS|nr:Transposon En/Spm-like [Arabidopsis thaliana x Arabidopsis arenosa]